MYLLLLPIMSSESSFLGTRPFLLQDIIEKGEQQPNLTIGILVSIVVVIATVIFRILFGGKKPAVSSLVFLLWSLQLPAT